MMKMMHGRVTDNHRVQLLEALVCCQSGLRHCLFKAQLRAVPIEP
ncbi:hypothetical protein EP837_03825 (plasmid) [Sphingobium sp. EP60837]|nr:hypothetical protein EP837_03825 [Sphingobium sp. EP60837]